jgi:vesicle coat complex subunit
MKSSELSELQIDLNSSRPDERKEAAKQVIAMMTIGKDVSSLFPHMVKCMETQSIELKKLVYLYIINYAKTKPDLMVMAVNSFQKDSRERLAPLLRALAVRTMSCIRIERITEHLCENLKDSLNDSDPYVKKTACIAVGKLYQTSPRLVKDHQFVKALQQLLLDGNAIVVANACASLIEISKASGKNYLPFNKGTYLNKVLAAVNDSNEWGQVYILEAVSFHDTQDAKEAENIVERVMPRLSHNNPAVILASVKLILKNLDLVPKDQRKSVVKKLAAPLITLLSCEAEIQYIAVRNINFVLQKEPTIFENNIKFLFCKFNDPLYLKLEKIEVLIKVVAEGNCESVLNELQDYSNDMDMDLVQAAVKAIG